MPPQQNNGNACLYLAYNEYILPSAS